MRAAEWVGMGLLAWGTSFALALLSRRLVGLPGGSLLQLLSTSLTFAVLFVAATALVRWRRSRLRRGPTVDDTPACRDGNPSAIRHSSPGGASRRT